MRNSKRKKDKKKNPSPAPEIQENERHIRGKQIASTDPTEVKNEIKNYYQG